MSQFDYVALDIAGRERRGRVAAPSPEAAREGLSAKKLYVVSLDSAAGQGQRGTPLLGPGLFDRNRLKGRELMLFTRQLSTLVQVSPLEEALKTIAIQTETPRAAHVVEAVHGGVFEGRRLAEAMASEARSFPPLYRAMVSAGEQSGSLSPILERLAALLERQSEIRSKILGAIAYPIVLAIVAVLVVAGLMIVVIPKIVEQFDTQGQQLPLLTRIVMGVSLFLANWWWAILIGMALLAIAGWFLLRNPQTRLAFDGWLLRIPLLGRLTRDLHAARMARTLSTMIAGRLPLYEGLTLTSSTIRNHALKASSEEIAEHVRGGGSLSAGLKRAGVFPPLLVYLAASGENSGRLEQMLERAADYLEREFDNFTTAALALLEPGIIVVMGGMVMTIVLAILLPIMQLQSMVGL
jgi:general secretion pathway protein F